MAYPFCVWDDAKAGSCPLRQKDLPMYAIDMPVNPQRDEIGTPLFLRRLGRQARTNSNRRQYRRHRRAAYRGNCPDGGRRIRVPITLLRRSGLGQP